MISKKIKSLLLVGIFLLVSLGTYFFLFTQTVIINFSIVEGCGSDLIETTSSLDFKKLPAALYNSPLDALAPKVLSNLVVDENPLREEERVKLMGEDKCLTEDKCTIWKVDSADVIVLVAGPSYELFKAKLKGRPWTTGTYLDDYQREIGPHGQGYVIAVDKKLAQCLNVKIKEIIQ